MNSLPTTERHNQEKFLALLQVADPELYLIKTALYETGVDPKILLSVIRSAANICYGSGYGEIQLFFQKGTLTQLREEEKVIVNQEVLVNVNE